VIDLSGSYKTKKYKIGLTIENLNNTEWNEAQFDTESRLKNETESVNELHFTPGTPFCAKIILGFIF
jgi:outer membrane receptor protein involved in Fe transport